MKPLRPLFVGLTAFEICAVLAKATIGGMVLDVVDAENFVKATLKGAFIGVAKAYGDALIESWKKIGALMNKILPDRFQIDIKGLDKLKSDGATVAEEIAKAIAGTTPSTFKQTAEAFWGALIKKQQDLVNAANKPPVVPPKTPPKKPNEKPGEDPPNDGPPPDDKEKKLADAAAKFQAAVQNFAVATKQLMDSNATNAQLLGALNGSTMAGMSDDALESLVRRDNQQQIGKDQGGMFLWGDSAEIYRLKAEVANAQRELDTRNNFRNDISGPGGVNANRDRYDPLVFEKLLQQFGPGSQDTNNRIANGIDKLNDQLNKGVPTVFFGNTSGS